MTGWEMWAWTVIELAKLGEPLSTGELVTDATLLEIHRAALWDGNSELVKAAWAATSLAPDVG